MEVCHFRCLSAVNKRKLPFSVRSVFCSYMYINMYVIYMKMDMKIDMNMKMDMDMDEDTDMDDYMEI